MIEQIAQIDGVNFKHEPSLFEIARRRQDEDMMRTLANLNGSVAKEVEQLAAKVNKHLCTFETIIDDDK